MSEHPTNPPLLTIRLEGKAVGHARISVDKLVRVLSRFSKAIYRHGKFLEGETSDAKTKARESSIKEKVALDVVMYAEGSRAVVIGLDKSTPEISAVGMDPTADLLKKSIDGLQQLQRKGEELPAGMDLGVLTAWKDLGVLFSQGISEMKFRLQENGETFHGKYTPEGFQILQEKIKGPITNVKAIEGRLLMADFKEQGTRCRIHPESGPPVLCLFKSEQADDVLSNMLHYVRIVGDAKIDPNTEKIETIRIIDIERLDELEGRATDLLPQGTPVSSEFWVPQSFDDLVRAQEVVPLEDPSILFGTWPGELDDGFEELISELRRAQIKNGA